MRGFRIAVISGLLFFSTPVFAFDVDVSGIINFLAKIYGFQTGEELPRLDDIKNNTLHTVNELKDVNKNLTGLTHYETLLNDIKKRQWSADKWTDALSSMGNADFKDAQKRYEQLYPIHDPNRKDSQLNNAYYEQSSKVTRTALAASEYSYNTINEHIDTVNQLLKKLTETQTQKQVADLNVRLLAEVSFIQLEMLKQQNIQTQLIATQSQREVNGLSDSKRFNQWNPK
ncbi:MAG: hypothetical protein LEGION0398_MBIBDBAK_00232 [Legionellaceae bacterium]